MNLSFHSVTHAGITRASKPNEDTVSICEGELNYADQGVVLCRLFIVADGMGGYARGKEASTLAIQMIEETVSTCVTAEDVYGAEDVAPLLREVVQKANLAVYQRNAIHHVGMGTTVTAAFLVGRMAYIANVGDSRTYLYRPGEGLQKITTDHSLVAQLLAQGQITEDDVYTHPQRNLIARCLGHQVEIEVDVFAVPLQPEDALLLCSDGLWEMVRDPAIAEILSTTLPETALTCQALLQAALDGGGLDNVSAVVVHCIAQ